MRRRSFLGGAAIVGLTSASAGFGFVTNAFAATTKGKVMSDNPLLQEWKTPFGTCLLYTSRCV